jgi:hypothetical protein
VKKSCVLVLLALLLSGCGSRETFETVNDELFEPVMAPAAELSLTLPVSAAAQAIQSEDGGRLYFCDGYVLTVQTLDGGDMERTAKELCGYGTDSLNIMETLSGDRQRRDWVWTSAGEGGDSIGRAMVLDDGHFHYCVTVMADAETVCALEDEWNDLFSSVRID